MNTDLMRASDLHHRAVLHARRAVANALDLAQEMSDEDVTALIDYIKSLK